MIEVKIDESILDELPEFDPSIPREELIFALQAYLSALDLLPSVIRNTAATRALYIGMFLNPPRIRATAKALTPIEVMAKLVGIR